ncbi:hypothetical protein PYW07_004034 [Mythimna separata]|uniref:Uncharacterized protein n=1 Tax=Mythimna separata TaxID=271217 RepID=A0AAD7YQA7_MYTSE|nr:hypothetical protein PYW07_004034 [Mythimna separata]
MSESKFKSVAMDSSITGTKAQSAKSLSFIQLRKTSKGLSASRTKHRKQSYGFSTVPSVGTHSKKGSTLITTEYKRPQLVYLNTYQLEPRVRFNVPHVTNAINKILDFFFEDFRYTSAEANIRTMLIADEVLRAVKNMKFDRFRIICVVTLAQRRAQSYNNAVAFLWDHEFDSVVDVHREEHTALIQVTVFGVYLD